MLPHVNKAGGRTLEASFDSSFSYPVYRFINALPRIRQDFVETHIISGHRSVFNVMHRSRCLRHFKGSLDVCEKILSSRDVCVRWIFMLRDPIARSISAFYTTVGRKVSATIEKPIARWLDHFGCPNSGIIGEKMQDPKFTIEDWAQLPANIRAECACTFPTKIGMLRF